MERLVWPKKCVGRNNFSFEKQSGEAIENKGSGLKNKAEQAGKQSREVIENR
jgi:hypothetical protein